ncbi:MAG: FHA domain-containing protein, partial [Gemmatimonas sp.]
AAPARSSGFAPDPRREVSANGDARAMPSGDTGGAGESRSDSHTDSHTASQTDSQPNSAAEPPSPAREIEVRQFTTFAKPVDSTASAGDLPSAPADQNQAGPDSAGTAERERDLRPGWGPQPGWPVRPAAGVPHHARYAAPMPGLPTRPRQNPPAAPNGNGHFLGAGATSNGLSHGLTNGLGRDLSHSASHQPAANGFGDAAADGDLSHVPGSVTNGHSIRYATPAEGTLQFLPGRLEISTGLDTGREIRFVRGPGPNGTEVTFGRNEGPIYRHIQLRDQTVSREHARMQFAEGHWTLTNLSRTNPVAHNGRVLRHDEVQQLTDGDRLEMGEVIFSFRSR